MRSIQHLKRLPSRFYSNTPRASRFLTSSSSTFIENEDFNYCLNQVKTYDYEGYLQILLFPKELQRPLTAIRAFNVEMATMKEQLPNNNFSLATRTRFQFWRDILNQCDQNNSEDIEKSNSNIPQQPLARELYLSIKSNNLSVRWFEKILEARQMELTRKVLYSSYDELEDYAEMTYSSLNYLILELLNLHENKKLNYIASHLGVCTGIINLLRAYPYHITQNTCHIPQEVLDKFQLTEEILFNLSPEDDENREKLFNAIHDVASQAYAHLNQVRTLYNEYLTEKKNLNLKYSDEIFLVFPLAPCELYLDYLLKCNFDPYEASTESIYTSPLYYQYKLLKLKFLKKI